MFEWAETEHGHTVTYNKPKSDASDSKQWLMFHWHSHKISLISSTRTQLFSSHIKTWLEQYSETLEWPLEFTKSPTKFIIGHSTELFYHTIHYPMHLNKGQQVSKRLETIKKSTTFNNKVWNIFKTQA